MHHASTEFYERGHDKTPRRIESGKFAPVGLKVGDPIEINYRDYEITHINPIVARIGNDITNCHITYQIHVVRIHIAKSG